MDGDIRDFKLAYQRLCKEHLTEIQDCVVKQIDLAHKKPRHDGSYSLNLSTFSLTAKTCGVLSKLLTSDKIFVDIKFNDCSLSEDAVKALVRGLAENIGCRRLDIKGNSIRGAAAETVGRMLRQNTKLNYLCLEWNEFGVIESSFSSFCEGLAVNTSLHTVDLRSNHISHHGAEDLASALKRNSTLRVLDLRFNTVGLLGARALLSCLDYNKTVVKLLLSGNNVPGDVLKAIEVAVSHNADSSSMKADHKGRQHVLSGEMQHINKTRQNEVIQLLDRVDRQEAALYHTKLSAAEKMNKLQGSLEERKQQFNNVATKLSMVESELSISESRTKELSQQLLQLKEEHESAASQHHQDTKRSKEDRALLERKLNKELTEVKKKKVPTATLR